MTKLLENIFRSVNIALVNEMKVVCLRMGIDIHEVIRAAATKPFGFMPFFTGPGLGGHCIPIDPFYLTSKAREYDISTRFIELAGEVNTSMPPIEQTLAGSDCILITTDHDAYDYPFILAHAPLIVDTRNVFPDPATTFGKVYPA
jgi:UDP-N-acetyl-D-mannosaminuronate dehydrogenase